MNSALALLATPEQVETTDSAPDLEEILVSAARNLRARLGTRTGTDLKISLKAAQLDTLGEFLIKANPKEPSVYITFEHSSFDVPGVAILPGRFIGKIITSMLDSTSEDDSFRAKRSISDLELRMAHRVAYDLISGISLSWPDRSDSRFTIVQMATHDRIVDEKSKHLVILGGVYDLVTSTSQLGRIPIAIPNVQVRKVSSEETIQKRVTEQLAYELPITLTAELTRTIMTYGFLQELQVGDIFPIGQSHSVSIRVDGKEVFKGEGGQSGGHHSVKLVKKLLNP